MAVRNRYVNHMRFVRNKDAKKQLPKVGAVQRNTHVRGCAAAGAALNVKCPVEDGARSFIASKLNSRDWSIP